MRETGTAPKNASTIVPAVIPAVFQVLFGSPCRFFCIAFGFRDSPFGLGRPPFKFRFSYCQLQPGELKLLLPFEFDASPVGGLIIGQFLGFYQNPGVIRRGIVGKMLNAIFIRPLIDIGMQGSPHKAAGGKQQ
jgi:hypothetical protein